MDSLPCKRGKNRNHEESHKKIDHKKTPQLTTEEESSRKQDNIEEHHVNPAETNRKSPPIIIKIFTKVLRGFIPSISEQELEELLKEEDINVLRIKRIKMKTDTQEMRLMPLHIIEASFDQKEKLINLKKHSRNKSFH
ncbi:hypothetical protein PR048_013579 [Dryococelus australis]|uniref:Uncharacterized protein n=1 Tax=Dryococelus australis TaxID=614101 RepID=A0ABQ9HTE9_9NEOP|nr:hypothetical protein PR048_013579 [Dryococelus australis]